MKYGRKDPVGEEKRVEKQACQQQGQLGMVTVFFGVVGGGDKKTRSFSWKCPTFFGKSPTFFCVSPWISFVLWAAIVAECEGCESKKCIIAVACARARETRCCAYAVLGNSANGIMSVNWDLPSLLLRHRWSFCIAAQVNSDFRPTNPPFQQWRAVRAVKEEETIRGKNSV